MKKRNVICIIFVLLLALACGYFYLESRPQHKLLQEPYARSNKCPYQYINPSRCEPATARKKKEYIVLRTDLNELIEKEKKDGKLTSAAVYFRDLQNGPIININDQESFIPASLLKLPLMITYLKKAQDDPSLLSRKIKVAGDVGTLPQNIKPEQTAQIGQTYTIDQLLMLLITQSDNTSWKVLLGDLRKNYSEDDFVSTLSDLGIVDPRKRTDQQYVTVQSYAAIFRILYNSSYLSTVMSDKALKILARSDFHDGLEAGVPRELTVAHKFGEQKNGDEQQLHDCGVVYYPPNPYIICVMTRGYNTDELKPIIQEISQKVYDEVKFRNQTDPSSQ
ncbi:serine hydrolase [Patescibacteria group bacterium]|nr:MAG: serine hydrolase [Patescibacteria group bacterium]